MLVQGRTACYAPSISAYVATSDNNPKYYDVTEDIVSCDITRNLDGASTATVKLQNKNDKYMDLFRPWDRITIYANRDGSKNVRLFTGYITDCPACGLEHGDVTLSCKCTIYRLEKLLWDADLLESQKVLNIENIRSKTRMADGGAAMIAQTILERVAGINPKYINIQKSIPDKVYKWAYDMYSAQLNDIKAAEEMATAFQSLLVSVDDEGATKNGETAKNLVASNDSRVYRMVEMWIWYCADADMGYSQSDRWTFPDYSKRDTKTKGNCDCSSLMYWCANQAGFNVPVGKGYTKTMKRDFVNAGFTWHDYSEVGNDINKVPAGAILWKSHHTAGWTGDKICEAWGSETENNGGDGLYGQRGDQWGGLEVRVSPPRNGWEGFFLYPYDPTKPGYVSNSSGVDSGTSNYGAGHALAAAQAAADNIQKRDKQQAIMDGE